ncbi:MAG: polyphosphate kinase 1 [Gemmatimonadaceae bacterium]|nr:polyphosphate kinase 1 [Gemmatimonadaceae bacterium]NUR35570.1 polyphosphate kinase 1 [Gemmatimonadaceae bacterium]NUS48692.1 polyphosphate kinase 1 [Gemmatimonadaceae bacterium]
MHDEGPPRPLYLNRELSWLAFNARVLHEAADPRVPLLERLKFLAIFCSNLDEFFMVRVAGLLRQIASGTLHHTPDGLTAVEQLAAIRDRVALLLHDQRRCLGTLLDELAPHGVRLVGMEELSAGERRAIDEHFESQIFPVLTPLAVDPGHPFPYVSNLSLSLAVEVRDAVQGTVHFARVKVPERLSRWVAVPGRTHQFVPLEQVIGENLEALFPGLDVLGWYAFRVTRYSDLEFTNLEDPDDLLASIEERVFERRFGEVIRLEVQDDMPPHLRALLLEELRDADFPARTSLSEADIDEAGYLLDLSALMELAALDIAELRDPQFTPSVPPELRDPDRSIFDVIRERDLLVHHPFDSFPATVERFLQSAAMDEQVLAIKLTLYRTSGDTAIVRALTEAAQRGKQVAVLVELRARFDEANNITWARTLEDYGVHVAYGSALLKTHTKTAMVVRREPDGIRRYIHIGSGNYNSRTARQYTDVGLFTCSPSIGADVSDLFNSLTGISRQRLYRKLLVAPANMRERFIELIERESRHAREGRGGRIVAKMNALVDAETIDALYTASEAGVEIDLIVRGICCLRPGMQGVSSRIRVISVVGRFLEHSRVWLFGNGGDEEVYLGSADWMPRNFLRRVEAVVPVEVPRLRERLQRLLRTYLEDNRQAWELDAEGRYTQRQPDGTERASQVRLLVDSWGLDDGKSGRREESIPDERVSG